MNNYMNLLVDLANVDKMIKEEEKALTLLSSLPDEKYVIFVLTVINSKQSLSYNVVSAAPVCHEVRNKDKESSFSNISAEALTARGVGSNHRKSKGDCGNSKTEDREI